MVALKVQISDQQAERLDDLARKLDVPSDTLAASAIEAFLDRETWQMAEIEAGLRDADAGDFASEAEVAAYFAAYARP
ncbi:MAG: Transcriptional regulator, CopG family [Hyphomicrobiales bacterium]|jgi:predicted transcriptional regulator|nr:Transcriptional regulator, CopG family [Hyphomicrobiales bacterium]